MKQKHNGFLGKYLWLQKHRFIFKQVGCNYFIRLSFFFIFAVLLFSTSGCVSNGRPRVRLGAYFGAPLGIAYPNPNNLGKHSYSSCWGERIGLLYTSKGGFIDLGHVRDSADRTRYCTQVAYENLISDKTEFSFRLMEPSEYLVKIKYPENWDGQVDKENIAREISIEIGQNLAYDSMIWHEIITWYGYKFTGVFSEYISAFSWEDVYSDIIGIEIAGRALRKDSDKYDSVMTKLIYDELHDLDVQPVSVAKKAEKKVKGKWYKGLIYPFATLKKRNMDIGIDDGYVTPWLVPGVCQNTKPFLVAVPNLDLLQKYGFSIEVMIEPKVRIKKKLLRVAYPDGKGKYIEPAAQFPEFMRDIINNEKKRNGKDVDVPNL